MPSLTDFTVGPLQRLGFVDVQHQVMMVRHDRIGADIDSEHLCQRNNSIFDPLAAVFEAFAGESITTAQESSANTAGSAMVVGCGIQRDELFSGLRHKSIFLDLEIGRASCRERA